LATLQGERLGAVVGGTEESRERAFCSGDSGCNWTCGAYSECFFTNCFCYTGYASECTC